MSLLDPPSVTQSGLSASIFKRSYGPVRDMANAPVTQVSTSTYSGAPTITDLQSQTSTITSSVLVGFDNAAFTYLGASLSIFSDSRFLTCSSPASNFVVVTFCSDAPVLELWMDQGTGNRWFIEVSDTGLDGFQQAAAQLAPAGTAGTPDLIKIDFGTTRRARCFRISGHRNLLFGGVRVGPLDTVWPLVDTRKLLVVHGDSYTDGTGATSRMYTYAGTFARLMNWRFWSEGIGGTGYTTAGANSPATRITTYINNLQQRVGGVNTAVTPDIFAIALGFNDAGAADASIQAGFDAAYAAATTKPNLIIGPWTPQGSTGALTTVRSLLIAKAAQYGIPYLDLSGWMNSSNNQILNNFPGDPVHPLPIGHDYLGFRMAQAARLLGL